MTTTVAFEKPPTKTNTVIIATKGTLEQHQKTFPVAFHYAPLKQENGPKSLTTFDGEHLVTITEFENKISRNLSSLRVDLVRKAAQDHVPAAGDATVYVIVKDKEQAFSAGLAIARNWHLYNKKTGSKLPDRKVYVQFHVENGDQVDYKELQTVANALRQAQRLMDTPTSELGVPEYVQEAKNLKEKLGAEVGIEVITGDALKKGGFGGFLGVGQAAGQSALVVLSYLPATATKTVALVGKGIVYDTGGLSLKPTASMCTMKFDMGGSAAVFEAFEVLVRQKVNKKVYALLCLAENAIGPLATRNDDIMYMHSGKTVEMNNTDAEGRLVLADGVSYASKNLKPDLILDIATLTGAQLIVTGTAHAAVLTASPEVESQVVASGKKTGDLVYPMLYCPELLMSQFDSKVADMKNSVKDRMSASSSCAGHFVEAHLDADYKGDWVHVDIAGPGSDGSRSHGFGVALLYDFVKNY
jgi:probable aminopeptidase NPEPL1